MKKFKIEECDSYKYVPVDVPCEPTHKLFGILGHRSSLPWTASAN